MHISVNIKNRWGYIIAFLLLLISYFLLFFIIKTLRKDAGSVSHPYAIINNLESIKAEINDVETGVRGYVLTSDIGFLKPYNSGSKQVFHVYHELKIHTAANKTYQEKVDSPGLLIDNKPEYLSNLIAKFQQEGSVLTGEFMSTFGSDKDMMENIRAITDDLQDHEQALMNVRNEKLRIFFRAWPLWLLFL